MRTYDSDDSEARSALSVKPEYSRSVRGSGLEDRHDSHMYDVGTLSGTGEESFNVEIPSDEEYFPTNVPGS